MFLFCRYRISKATHPNVTLTKYFPHRTRFSKDEIRKLHPEETLAIRVMLAEMSGHETSHLQRRGTVACDATYQR